MVRVFLVTLGELAEIGCRRARRNLTRDEWIGYLGDYAVRGDVCAVARGGVAYCVLRRGKSARFIKARLRATSTLTI